MARAGFATATTSLLTLGLIGAQVVVGPSAHAVGPNTYYAAPSGGGWTCSQTSPCLLPAAIMKTAYHDVVILEPGSYPGPGAVYTDRIQDTDAITIMGQPGAPMPTISSVASSGAVDLAYGSTISHVEIDYSGSQAALQLDGAFADHVEVVSSSTAAGPGSAACEVAGPGSLAAATITDSLCIQTGTNAVAIGGEANGGTWGATVRNVTAVATGTGGVGADFGQAGTGSTTAAIVNSIIRGTVNDVVAEGTSNGPAHIALSNCDFTMTDPGAYATITKGTGNTTAAPRFLDPARGDFTEHPSSPTVDAGTASGIAAHDTDLAGKPRALGSRPDIGAYELAERARVHHVRVKKVRRTSFHVAARVNGEGSATKAKAVVTRHGHLVEALKNPHAVTHSATVRFVLHFLEPGRNYHVRIVATNSAGTTKTPKRTLHTKS